MGDFVVMAMSIKESPEDIRYPKIIFKAVLKFTMNKPTLYTLVISLVVVAIGVIMWVCGQFYRHTFIGETLNIIGGLIFSLGLTLIPIIGYCVKMSMEKNKARREQIDAT